MTASRVAEADHTVNGILAMEVCNALAAFLCVESFVNQAKAHFDCPSRTIRGTS